MYGFLLQDWTTIRGTGGATGAPGLVVTQSESNWVSLQPYQDIIFFLEVREVTVPTGAITLAYETSPLKDESLFVAMATVAALAVTPVAITPTKVILATTAGVPLARWVRWKLTSTTTSGAWDATFRIAAAANAVGVVS